MVAILHGTQHGKDSKLRNHIDRDREVAGAFTAMWRDYRGEMSPYFIGRTVEDEDRLMT